MNCYAWDIPNGCYAAAEDAASSGAGCPTPWWFWLTLAGAAALAMTGRGRQSRPAGVVRARRKR
jgi:hypothetical protein